MSEDWLKKWYRENYSQSSPEAIREDTWEKIEEKINDWSGYWYASNAKELEVTPPENAWSSLSVGVEQAILLRKSIRNFWMRAIGVSALFILLPYLLSDYQMSLITSHTAQNSELIAELSSTTQTTGTQQTPNTELVSEETVPAIASSNQQEASQHPTVSTTVLAINPIIVQEESSVNPTQTTTEQDISRDHWSSVSGLPVNTLSQLEPTPNLTALLTRTTKKPLRTRLWSVTAGSSFQHSTLYNPTSQKGNNYQSSITNKMGSAVSIDISVGRRISNRGFVQAGLRLNDVKSQHFMDFVGSEYMEKSLTLTYQSIDMSYHHSLFANRLKGRFGLELNSGIYTSYRTDIDETWGDEDRTVLRNGFKKFDLGGKIGLDGIYALHPAVDVKLGAFYTNGFINIFDGIEGIPSYFYRTFTTSFGASLGLRYNF